MRDDVMRVWVMLQPQFEGSCSECGCTSYIGVSVGGFRFRLCRTCTPELRDGLNAALAQAEEKSSK